MPWRTKTYAQQGRSEWTSRLNCFASCRTQRFGAFGCFTRPWNASRWIAQSIWRAWPISSSWAHLPKPRPSDPTLHMQYRRVRRNRTLRLNHRVGLGPKQPGAPISRCPRSSVDAFWIGLQLVRGTPSWRSSSGLQPDRFRGSESAKRVLPSSGGVKKRHLPSSRNPWTRLCAFCASRMTLLCGRTMVNFSSTVGFDYNRQTYLKEQTVCEKDRENQDLGRAPLNPKRSKARMDKAIPHSGMMRQSTGGHSHVPNHE